MKIEMDTLKCVKMLAQKGLNDKTAQAIVESFTDINIRNLYTKSKVDIMLSEAVQKTFDDLRRESDRKYEAAQRQHREVEKKHAVMQKMMQQRVEADIAEARSGRRWLIGTIITCTLALAGYLSALIHFTH